MITGFSVFRPGIGLLNVAPGETVELIQGDTLRITASYTYKAQWPTSVRFIGYIGSYNSRKAWSEVIVNLDAAAEEQSGDVTIDIVTSGSTSPGTWGVGIMIRDTTVFDEIPNCVVVEQKGGIIGDISSMIGMVMMVMIMGMMMPMMSEDM